ncbi:MAG: hypothetical protein QXT50_01090, partial [Thermofilum sp.]
MLSEKGPEELLAYIQHFKMRNIHLLFRDRLFFLAEEQLDGMRLKLDDGSTHICTHVYYISGIQYISGTRGSLLLE